MIKCGLCGKEFEDDQFEEYASHVNKCAADMRLKKDTEKLKKIQNELEEVKSAKVCYESLRNDFKEKYPDIYKANFPDEVEDKSSNKKPKRSNVHELENIDDFSALYDFINYLYN